MNRRGWYTSEQDRRELLWGIAVTGFCQSLWGFWLGIAATVAISVAIELAVAAWAWFRTPTRESAS
jgi:hypothetical protein